MRTRVVLGTWWRLSAPAGDDIHFNLRLHLLERWNLLARVSPAEGRLLTVLLGAGGEPIRRGQLIDVLYGDDEDGGPVEAADCISVHAVRLARLVRPCGLAVVADRKRGLSIADLGRPEVVG